jgi:hypothetical protein
MCLSLFFSLFSFLCPLPHKSMYIYIVHMSVIKLLAHTYTFVDYFYLYLFLLNKYYIIFINSYN